MGKLAFPALRWYDHEMKNKIWINKTDSFEDALKFDKAYYLSLSTSERVEAVQIFREAHFRSSGLLKHENGKRLRRVLSVVEQA